MALYHRSGDTTVSVCLYHTVCTYYLLTSGEVSAILVGDKKLWFENFSHLGNVSIDLKVNMLC